MPLGWLDVSDIPFDAVALLERFQMRMLVRAPKAESLAIALQHNPSAAWCLRTKCPDIAGRVDELLALVTAPQTPTGVRRHERAVLDGIQDWLLYVLDPAAYDALPFLGWDSDELLALTDFRGKTVLDVGAGTGRLTFAVAPLARAVYACEPVGNLRDYVRAKAARLGHANIFALDGFLAQIPFAEASFDVTMCAHVFGDEPAEEHAEMTRVTRPGGMLVLCPGNNDRDDDRHAFLVEHGFAWARFEEPVDGTKRKYWKRLPAS